MLLLDKSPKLCAKYTPYCFYWNILNSFKVCQNISDIDTLKSIPQGTLVSCIYFDLRYSFKNLQWYDTYINELISIHNDVMPDAVRSFITINTDEILNKQSGFFSNPLKIHSPLLESTFWDLDNTSDNKYSSLGDAVQISRAILVDMCPQLEDFPKGAPMWLLNSSYKTSLCAFDILNRRHIKIEPTQDGLKYYTSMISNNWKEVEGVPKEMDMIVSYLLTNRNTLSLVD